MVRQEFCGYRVSRFSRIACAAYPHWWRCQGGGGAYFAFDLDATPSGFAATVWAAPWCGGCKRKSSRDYLLAAKTFATAAEPSKENHGWA
jgi:hypothetical protein